MKKLFTLLTISLFLLAHSSIAANFVVSGATNGNENGIYVETGIHNSKPYYTFNTNYYISWSGINWELGQGCCNGDIFGADCSNPSSAGTCPDTGWDCIGLVVAPEGDNLAYSGNLLLESINNDGSFPGAITISLSTLGNGQGFTGNNGDDYAGNKITFGTLPVGLTPHAVRTDSSISLIFTGAATNNNHADDTWLTLQFTDAAFANDTAAHVINYIDSVHLVYREGFTVASSGGDFSVIADAIEAASDYDVITISGETYTEPGLAVDKAITFIGQGADQTIIQADTSYNTASDRVFNVSATDTVEFRGLTIRNGNSSSGNGEGGAIYSLYAPVNIYNCALTGNIASSSGSAYGGAIYCASPLKIIASLIANNTAVSSTNCWGGAINCGQLYMVNSTMTGDTITAATTSYGTAIYSEGEPVTIINCTITSNTSTGGGALNVDNGSVLNLINSIVYGNTGGDDVTIMNATPFNASNCIMGASSTAAISGTNYNVSTADPLLSPLANNGGTTFTMAINSGSFAIDEGATGDSIPTTDQRGYLANGIRDIGAFEYGGLVLGTKALSPFSSMAVYPNPANDFINVVTASGINSGYTITNLLGQTVLTGQLTAKHAVINISTLSAGVYIFKAGTQQCKLLKE